MTTTTAHGLSQGDSVSISKIDNSVTYFVATTASANSTTITVASSANLKPGQLVTYSPNPVPAGYTPALNPGTKITSITGNTLTISKATATAIAGLTVSYTQGSTLNGTFEVSSVVSSTSFRYVIDTFDVAQTATPGGLASYKKAVLGTSASNGIVNGNLIVVEKVDSDYDGVHTVTGATQDTITYNVFNSLNKATEGVFGGVIKVGARAVASTFGAFSGNSSIGLQVDTTQSTPFPLPRPAPQCILRPDEKANS